jgi:hypothetical protein
MFLTRKDNTSIIEAPFLWSGCGRVVKSAGHKANRFILQCINGVSSNPVEVRVTCDNRLLLNITYVGKLNQTVLELDLLVLTFVFLPRRDLNSHH